MYPSISSTFTEVTKRLGTNFRVFFKNELEQPSGSFKLRGLGYLIGQSLAKAKVMKKEGVQVFSSSGGNAGLAAAYAAQFYKVPCTVVLPIVSKQVVITKLESLGAKVIVEGRHWGEADAFLRETLILKLPESIYPVYCHPFDDPIIWDGHAKFIDEVVELFSKEDLSHLKAVICSVGGGGLYNGVVEGLDRNGLKEVPVVAVETIQAPTFTEAVKAGKQVHLETVKTIATSLASPYISEKSLENYYNHKTILKTIDDIDAIQGTIDYYDKFHKLIEPACGAAIATVLKRLDLLSDLQLKEDDIVVVVVCGGSAVSEEVIQEYRKML